MMWSLGVTLARAEETAVLVSKIAVLALRGEDGYTRNSGPGSIGIISTGSNEPARAGEACEVRACGDGDSSRWLLPNVPLPCRTLHRANPTVCGCTENDARSVVKRAEDAEMLRFREDQNASDNQLLARTPSEFPGNYALPLPYVIAPKTRGSQ
jgi:hypothetical protein